MKNGLNPIWEKVRGYSVTAMGALTLVSILLCLLSIFPIPVDQTTADDNSYSNVNLSFDCVLLLMISDCVVAIIFLYFVVFVSSRLTGRTPVRKSVTCFREATDMVCNESHLGMTSLADHALQVLSENSSDAHNNIRNGCFKLTVDMPTDETYDLYIRNCKHLSCLTLARLVYLALYSLIWWWHRQIATAVEYNYHVEKMWSIAHGAAYILLLVHLLAVSYGCYAVEKYQKECHEKMKKSVRLLLSFLRNSSPERHETVKGVVSHIYSNSNKTYLQSIFAEAWNENDFRLIAMIHGAYGPSGIIISKLHRTLETETLPLSSERYMRFIEACDFQIKFESTRKFVKFLVNKKYWEILVHLIENSDLKRDVDPDERFESLVKPIPEGLECGVALERRSIVYYAVHERYAVGPNKFVAARFLIGDKDPQSLKIKTQLPEERVHQLNDFMPFVAKRFPGVNIADIFS